MSKILVSPKIYIIYSREYETKYKYENTHLQNSTSMYKNICHVIYMHILPLGDLEHMYMYNNFNLSTKDEISQTIPV